MRISGSLAVLLIIFGQPLYGQLIPASAQTNLYFPQLADGGPATGQWQTTFTFANPNPSAVSATIFLLSDEGKPLALDFGSGSGSQSQFSISVPPFGSRTLQSRIESSTILTGWAIAQSSSSLQGVASYRFLQNGVETSEVSVPATQSTTEYFSLASPFLGIAIANIYNVSSRVYLTARDNSGLIVTGSIMLPPTGKRSLSLREALPELSPAFNGTVTLDGLQSNGANYYFAALTLKSDNGSMYSSLPSGAAVRPVRQEDRIHHVFARLRAAYRLVNLPQPETIQLNISMVKQVNAHANANGIQINMALAELIADSESELAFAVAHQLGHVYQSRTGQRQFDSTDPERDADAWGLALSLIAGYDPYAAAGALAKLAMATGQAALMTQLFEGQYSPSEAHASFNDRLAQFHTTIRDVCTEMGSACVEYRQLYHPNVPTGSLLTTLPYKQ